VSLFGIDYAYGNGITAAQMKTAGVHFACRYLATLPNPKVINKTEFTNLTAAGIAVILVWEQSGRDCDRWYAGGQTDAREALRQAAALGYTGAIYFAPADYDAPQNDQPKIDSYMDGAVSVVGIKRTGFYGGYWTCRRVHEAGKATYFWQTYAWSGSNLPGNRADLGGFTRHLYQYSNGERVGPAEVDFNHALAADYGQHPRPAAPPAPPPPPAGPGPYLHHTSGERDMNAVAAQRNTTLEAMLQRSAANWTADDWQAVAATLGPLKLAGFPYYTVH
jgi:Rv2525c-like, glycoside hydrolase-like domain